MSKRAAIITAFDPFSYKGGIETYTVNLIDLLKRHNVETDIFHTGMADKDHEFHNDYLGKLYVIGRKVLENDQYYDLIITHNFYGLGYFPPRLNTYNIFHSTHMAFAEEIKDVVPKNQYLEWKLLWGKLCESASGFERIKIAVSESVRDELKRYYGFDDVAVVDNGVDTKVFMKSDKIMSRRGWRIPEDHFVGLYVGRWDTLKGCDILEGIMDERPDIFWVVILGTGYDKDTLPKRDNLFVIEQIDHNRMHEIYSAADFMLFPSRYEGFGYAIAEAMACGLPVITTNVGIARTIYKKEPFNKLLLPHFSKGVKDIIVSATEKIEYVKSCERFVDVIIQRGSKLIEGEYHIDLWKRKMAEILGI